MITTPLPSVQELVERMELAVLLAAQSLAERLSDQPGNVQVWRKPDLTLVLSLDLESQEILRRELGGVLPCISEEDISSHSLLSGMRDGFLLDPLDGTTSCKRFLGISGGQLGFGPLVGLLQGGQLVACSFFNLPRRMLYTAVRELGAWRAESTLADNSIPTSRTRLAPEFPNDGLLSSALLFYPGAGGELRFVEFLRKRDLIENAYRFGGFANDCARVAEGFEQIQVQFACRAWDYSATLLAHEAGLAVTVDPLGARLNFTDWTVAENNPVLICPPGVRAELLGFLDECLAPRS